MSEAAKKWLRLPWDPSFSSSAAAANRHRHYQRWPLPLPPTPPLPLPAPLPTPLGWPSRGSDGHHVDGHHVICDCCIVRPHTAGADRAGRPHPLRASCPGGVIPPPNTPRNALSCFEKVPVNVERHVLCFVGRSGRRRRRMRCAVALFKNHREATTQIITNRI